MVKHNIQSQKDTYEEIIEWLETHEGRMPRGAIRKDRKKMKKEDLTEKEVDEINLYARWRTSKLCKMLDEYAGIPIEKISESEEIKERIKTLRSYGLGMKEKTAYEEIIEWLEVHGGRLPQNGIYRDGRTLKKEELTEEEFYERNLYGRWIDSQEYKILKKYIEVPIEEIPESEEIKERIKTLRNYGLGKTAYVEIIEWLESHEGGMPRGNKQKNGKKLKKEEMTKEELYEKNLYARWKFSDECKILEKYVGTKIEEVPEEWREKVSFLRSYGLGMKKTTYEEIIEWLESHEGRMPRNNIQKNGKRLKKEEMTKEEHYEKKLCARWQYSKERKMLNKFAGVPIEEVPEEWREKIARLRSLGQLGKSTDERIKGRMKEAVGNRVESNEAVRKELEEIVKENGNKCHGEQTE